MNHLGDRATALVDERLDPDARERVLCHLVGCPACRGDVGAERALHGLLTRLRHTEMVLPPSLRERLLDVPPVAAYQPYVRPGAARYPRRGRSMTARQGVRGWPPRRVRRRRTRLALAGSLSVGAATVAVAFVVGGQPSGPSQTPPRDVYTVEHVAAPDAVPLTDPASGAVTLIAHRTPRTPGP